MIFSMFDICIPHNVESRHCLEKAQTDFAVFLDFLPDPDKFR